MAKKQIEQTEIEVPYELPEGWKWVRLDSIAELKGGKRIPAGFRCTEQITPHVYIRVSDMQNDSICMDNLMYISEEVFQTIKKYTISKNDLYLTIAGTIGRVGTIPDSLDNMNLTENALKITNIKCDKKYLLYSLKSEYTQNYFSKSYHQVAMPKLSMLNASKTLIPFPPTLEEQQQIVNRIETLFAKLDLAKEKAQNVVDTFETRKASILHKAFTGELTKKWREENGVGDDSWEEKTVGECLYPMTTKTPSGETFRYIDIDAINNEIQKVDSPKLLKTSEAPSRASRELKENDVLFSMVRPYLKNIALIDNSLCDCIASTGFYVCRCKEDLSPFYLYVLLCSKDIIDYLMQFMKGDNSPSIRKDDLLTMPINVPTLPEQAEIVRILDTILEKETKAKESAEAVLEQIDLLKKSILARAFRSTL